MLTGVNRFRRAPRLQGILWLGLVGVSALVAGAAPPSPTPAPWQEGAAGFERALDDAISGDEPLVVYFYTDWCGYCRQLERTVLYRPETEAYLAGLPRVRINPEAGDSERAIARRYGVNSYPSLFLHPGPGKQIKRLSGRVRRDGSWQMQTPAEFIDTVQSFIESAEPIPSNSR